MRAADLLWNAALHECACRSCSADGCQNPLLHHGWYFTSVKGTVTLVERMHRLPVQCIDNLLGVREPLESYSLGSVTPTPTKPHNEQKQNYRSACNTLLMKGKRALVAVYRCADVASVNFVHFRDERVLQHRIVLKICSKQAVEGSTDRTQTCPLAEADQHTAAD